MEANSETVTVGYGFCHLPTSPGTHEIECVCWKPVGNLTEQAASKCIRWLALALMAYRSLRRRRTSIKKPSPGLQPYRPISATNCGYGQGSPSSWRYTPQLFNIWCRNIEARVTRASPGLPRHDLALLNVIAESLATRAKVQPFPARLQRHVFPLMKRASTLNSVWGLVIFLTSWCVKYPSILMVERVSWKN